MSIYLVRHAKAGSRSDWDGEDIDRPLSKNGWKQAQAIADRLATRGVSELFSSPFLRCRQTLEPLAGRTDLDLASEPRLGEGTPFELTLALLSEVRDGAVLCSHGDVIPGTVAALERRGCHVDNHPDWSKGTVWSLERSADGQFVKAKVWSPPA